MSAGQNELEDIEHSKLSADQRHGWLKIPDDPKVEALPKTVVEDFSAKVVVVGCPSGKTSLVNRFLYGKFNPDVKSTVAAEFRQKEVGVDGHRVRLQLWDTGGLESFRSLVPEYCRKVVGALLVFDLTSRASFREIKTFKGMVCARAGQPVTMILIGNKVDLEERRKVPEEEARAYARRKKMEYFETSAATGANVEDAFMACALGITNKKVNGEEIMLEITRSKSGCGK
jgi:small GTP-binding protein